MIKIHHTAMISGCNKNSPKSFFFIFPVKAQQRAVFSVFSRTLAQGAAHYLQKQLLTHLGSNLVFSVYVYHHIPVMIIPECTIKHYLDFNTEAELTAKTKRFKVVYVPQYFKLLLLHMILRMFPCSEISSQIST